MKRTLLIGLALLFMVSALVVGCSSEKPAEQAPAAVEQAAPAAEVAAPAAAPEMNATAAPAAEEKTQ